MQLPQKAGRTSRTRLLRRGSLHPRTCKPSTGRSIVGLSSLARRVQWRLTSSSARLHHSDPGTEAELLLLASESLPHCSDDGSVHKSTSRTWYGMLLMKVGPLCAESGKSPGIGLPCSSSAFCYCLAPHDYFLGLGYRDRWSFRCPQLPSEGRRRTELQRCKLPQEAQSLSLAKLLSLASVELFPIPAGSWTSEATSSRAMMQCPTLLHLPCPSTSQSSPMYQQFCRASTRRTTWLFSKCAYLEQAGFLLYP
mmetsp:Transcript_22961/g.42213  ORF Transcript_22961/g.42213 Transcript_22961/m.42213 type:complete len:252 (+) Transcript_22961:263-1018(+)